MRSSSLRLVLGRNSQIPQQSGEIND